MEARLLEFLPLVDRLRTDESTGVVVARKVRLRYWGILTLFGSSEVFCDGVDVIGVRHDR